MIWLSVILSFFIGIGAAFLVQRLNQGLHDQKRRKLVDKEIDRIFNRAKSKAAKIQKEAEVKVKDYELTSYNRIQNEIKQKKRNLERKEQEVLNLAKKQDEDFRDEEAQLDKSLEELKAKEDGLNSLENELQKKRKDLESQQETLRFKFESILGMSQEQVKEELKESLRERAKEEFAPIALSIEKENQAIVEEKSKRILSQALSRYASEVSSEKTVTALPLSDDMKGRVIGKEGRNIRTFESVCGVDIIVDEALGSVVISCFDPVRREVARESLSRLMEDGRIHPAYIEEVVRKVKSEVFSRIKDLGEKACFDSGVYGLHEELIKLLGELNFRTVGAQNLYQHSLEVSSIAGLLAEELGFSVKTAQRVGLLHDIGLAVSYTVHGSHAQVGAKITQKYGEKKHICDAIATHEDETSSTLLGNIVQTANKLSKSRPGARRENIKQHIARLSDLESISNSFAGVVKTYALQAGREVRVIVDSGRVTDVQARMLSSDIARKIEREKSYGNVKVNVLREVRIVDYAR